MQVLRIAVEKPLYIFIRAIVFAVTVPWRNIETIFHFEFSCGCCEISWNVGIPSVFISRAGDVMVCSLGWPQAESIVMFDYCNATFHSRSFRGFEPLCRVRGCSRGKQFAVFIAESPLLIGIGVHSIVEKCIKFRFLPSELSEMREGMYFARFIIRIFNTFVL